MCMYSTLNVKHYRLLWVIYTLLNESKSTLVFALKCERIAWLTFNLYTMEKLAVSLLNVCFHLKATLVFLAISYQKNFTLSFFESNKEVFTFRSHKHKNSKFISLMKEIGCTFTTTILFNNKKFWVKLRDKWTEIVVLWVWKLELKYECFSKTVKFNKTLLS
jgi:hypothetical protein